MNRADLMKIKPLVAFLGAKGSGKTHLAGQLNLALTHIAGVRCQQCSFSFPLKIAFNTFADVYESRWDELPPDDKERSRPFMTECGDLVKKVFGEDYFVKALVKKASRAKPDKDFIIVDDARFPLEVQGLAEHFNTVFVYVNNGASQSKKDVHASERTDLILLEPCVQKRLIEIDNSKRDAKIEDYIPAIFDMLSGR